MTPEQTDSKVLPYLYSQCEETYCRSIAPMQDTPSIKFTYSADILVDSRFIVRMSAVNYKNTTIDSNTLFSFEMEIPLPSYLIAIVVGNLV